MIGRSFRTRDRGRWLSESVGCEKVGAQASVEVRFIDGENRVRAVGDGIDFDVPETRDAGFFFQLGAVHGADFMTVLIVHFGDVYKRQLFHMPRRADRATKLLAYLGDVILNGNPEVKGKTAPSVFEPPPIPRSPSSAPPPGSRQMLLSLGPKRFAAVSYTHLDVYKRQT